MLVAVSYGAFKVINKAKRGHTFPMMSAVTIVPQKGDHIGNVHLCPIQSSIVLEGNGDHELLGGFEKCHCEHRLRLLKFGRNVAQSLLESDQECDFVEVGVAFSFCLVSQGEGCIDECGDLASMRMALTVTTKTNDDLKQKHSEDKLTTQVTTVKSF